jgi:3-hydroxymyristoyl/3-hydroxydecanoyl-(acyl carrier protein) dehydratase
VSGDVEALLAHRAPFLFVDEITELTPGVSARARWTTPLDAWPAVLLVEAIAQTGGLAIGQPGLLAVVRSASVSPDPPRGQIVDLTARITRTRTGYVELEGDAHRGTDQIATARLTLSLTPER